MMKCYKLIALTCLHCVYKADVLFETVIDHGFYFIMEIINTKIVGQKLYYRGHMYSKKKTLKDSLN